MQQAVFTHKKSERVSSGISNLRRIVLFQSKNAPEVTNGPRDGLLLAVLASLKTMSQTLEHLKLCFPDPAMVAAGLKY